MWIGDGSLLFLDVCQTPSEIFRNYSRSLLLAHGTGSWWGLDGASKPLSLSLCSAFGIADSLKLSILKSVAWWQDRRPSYKAWKGLVTGLGKVNDSETGTRHPKATAWANNSGQTHSKKWSIVTVAASQAMPGIESHWNVLKHQHGKRALWYCLLVEFAELVSSSLRSVLHLYAVRLGLHAFTCEPDGVKKTNHTLKPESLKQSWIIGAGVAQAKPNNWSRSQLHDDKTEGRVIRLERAWWLDSGR